MKSVLRVLACAVTLGIAMLSMSTASALAAPQWGITITPRECMGADRSTVSGR